MPAVSAEYEHPAVKKCAVSLYLSRNICDYPAFIILSFGIQSAYLFGIFLRFLGSFGHKELQCVRGRADAPRRIYPRSKRKCRRDRCIWSFQPRLVYKGSEALIFRVFKIMETVTDDFPVLPRERNNVGNGGNSRKVGILLHSPLHIAALHRRNKLQGKPAAAVILVK